MKRLVSMFITLSMMVMMFAALPVNAEGVTENSVQVGAAKLTAENKYLNYSLSNQTTSAASTKDDTTTVAEYDAATGTLTFTKSPGNFIGAVEDSTYTGKNKRTMVIRSAGDLTICINKDVVVWLYQDNKGSQRTIWTDGNLTLKGEGTLKAATSKGWDATSYALYSEKAVVIDGLTTELYTWEQTSDGSWSTMIYGKEKIEIKNDAAVKATVGQKTSGSTNNKIFSQAPILYTGARAKASESAPTDYYWNKIGTAPTDLAEYDANKFDQIKWFQVEPSASVNVGGAVLKASAPYLHITNNGNSADNSKTDSSAVWDYSTNTLKFTKTASVKSNTKISQEEVIYSDDDLNIEIADGVTVTVYSNYSYEWGKSYSHLISSKKNIKISGTGTLNAYADGSGDDNSSVPTAVIYAGGNVEIEGITAKIRTINDKPDRSPYVIHAGGSVEIKSSADCVLATKTAGHIFNNNEKVTLAPEADMLMCDDVTTVWNNVTLNTNTYYYDKTKLSSAKYLSFSTMSDIAAIKDLKVNGDANGAVKAGENEIAFTPAKGSGAVSGAKVPLFVIAAVHDTDGRLINAAVYSTEDITEIQQTLNVTANAASDTIKVFVWNGSETLVPLKTVKTF